MKKISITAQQKAAREIISIHTERFRPLMIFVASVLAAFGLFLSIYWNFDNNSAGEVLDNVYLIGSISFTVISLILVVLLILNKFKIIPTKALYICTHSYVFLVIGWSTMMTVMDLSIGLTPIYFLMIAAAVAGLFVVEPLFFTLLILISYSTIMIFVATNHYVYFEGAFRYENFINLLLFSLIVVVSVFKQFVVTYREYRAIKRLEELSYTDELTGLLNERSYISKTEEIADKIQKEEMEDFAVVLMDVNNLKNTNDQFGHRFGCHLVIKCGHDLPSIFKTSKLFHIGGDEFLAIVLGDDYLHFDEKMKEFDEKMTYSLIKYEGKELIFSVARGFSKYQKGDQFKTVLQRADKEMYKNKAQVKEKYHIGGR